MNKKNKYKAVVALVIALAFLLPSAVAVVSDEEIVNRNVSSSDVDNISNVDLQMLDKEDMIDDTPSTLFVPPWGWSDDIQLTNVPEYSFIPEIAVDSNDNIHIVWEDWRDGNPEIYYTKLDNDGNTLKDDTRLTNDIEDSNNPRIAVDLNDNVHIVWDDWRCGLCYEIYYTKLDNNGNTLVDDIRVTNATCIFMNDPVVVVDSNNNLHITWNDRVNEQAREVFYAKLDNNGTMLVNDTMVSEPSYHSEAPTIAVDSNNNVHITWEECLDGNNEIYYTKLDNDGNTLKDDIRLTFDPGNSIGSIRSAVDSNNNLHITWQDRRIPHDDDYEVYYTKLDNNGNTLVNDTRLIGSESGSSAIAVDSNDNIHIVFSPFSYIKLDNDGNTLVDVTSLSHEWGLSVIALDSNDDVHVAMYMMQEGIFDIWYKRTMPVDHDLSITSIDSPVSGPVSIIIPEVTVENLGTFSETNIMVNMQIFKIPGGLWEDFSGSYLPAGWDEEEVGEWHQSPSSGAGGTSPEVRCDWDTISDDYAYLQSVPVDVTGAPSLTLKFKSFIDDYGGSASYNCYVKVRADAEDTWLDVTPWTNPPTSNVGPDTYTIDVGSDIGTGVQVMFEFDGAAFDMDFWHVDDVQIGPPPSLEYDKTATANFNIGESKSVLFPSWIPVGSGFTDYQVTACIQTTDDYPYNDCMVEPVTLELLPFETVTNLSYRWNMISIPFNHSINKADFVVEYDGTDYTWADAVTADIVADAFFGWDRTNQMYAISDVLEPGRGYWLWAYEDCVLKVSA